MSDALQPPPSDEDKALVRLFARRLADEALPPAVLERLTLRVLDEVQHTLPGSGEETPVGRSAPAGSPWPYLLQTAAERLRSWLRHLSPNQSLLLAGACAVAAMLLFVGISRIAPRPLTAAAAVSGGDATVLNLHTHNFRVQGDGDQLKLRQGDRILTADGSVQLAHFPRHVTLIEPGADVELTHLDDAEGGMQLALTVHDGLVHSTIDEPLGPHDRYTVHTPGVTVTATGTRFAVETVSEQETLVTTYSGSVEVTMDGQTVTLGPGQEVDAVAGQALEVQPADGRYDGGRPLLLLTVSDGEGSQLYAQPHADSAPIGRLPAGQTVTIEAQDPSGRWLQVCCIANQSGWIQLQ